MKPLRIPSFLKTVAKEGASPGTLTHVGQVRLGKPHVTVLSYNKETFEEVPVKDLNTLENIDNNNKVNWINIDGLHDTKIIEQVGKSFDLHKLILEDILNTTHRPKIEELQDKLFIVVKMLDYDEKNDRVGIEQVSIILQHNTVITFQEQTKDVFDSIRERLRNNQGRLRTGGADYLMYRILDALTDGYFAVLEKMGDRIEAMEQEFLDNPDDEFISFVYSLRREMLFLRKAVHPLRDVVGQLDRAESVLIQDATQPFLRDVYDHAIQASDSVDTFRDLLANMLDNYLSVMSHKMNSIMKVLTIVGSIFIPLTFIAGIYGMNFENMPELKWAWGYPVVWGIMIILTISMLIVMRRKKWL